MLAWIAQWLHSEPQTQGLIFVYQTRSTQTLAQAINQTYPQTQALPYHSQMAPAQRQHHRTQFQDGYCRLLVTTTALALGLNLPAQQVLVRDNTFAGVGPLPVSDLLQMMGRAGRGNQAGTATVLWQPGDRWALADLQAALQSEHLPPLQSVFCPRLPQRSPGSPTDPTSTKNLSHRDPPGAVALVTTLCSWPHNPNAPGATQPELNHFLSRSWGGPALIDQLPDSLSWLQDKTLAHCDPHHKRHQLTVLGQAIGRSMLPLSLGSAYAQLLRDLFSLDPHDQLLSQWRSLDHLLILSLSPQSVF